jgi:hypothetical protein
MSRCPACETAARKERAAQRAAGEIEGTPDRNGRVMHFSPEERQRRSDRAKELHAQGRFGGATIGANGGRAVGRHRIVDTVLEYFRQPEKQELVSKAIESNLKGKSKPARLAAVRELRFIEQMQDERLARDRGGGMDPAEMTLEALQEMVAQGLEAMIAGGQIPADIELGEDAVRDLP